MNIYFALAFSTSMLTFQFCESSSNSYGLSEIRATDYAQGDRFSVSVGISDDLT